MQIFRPHTKFKFKNQKPIITIGSFDGVHLGHQKIINMTKAQASKFHTTCGVVTFSPLPIIYFSPNFTYLITDEKEREKILESMGLDFLYYFQFDKNFSELEPFDFIKQVKEIINPREIIVGSNHRFGRNQKGDTRLLKTLGKKFNIKINIIKPRTIGNTKISSTAIREALLLGNITLANRMLGYEYSIKGTVCIGAGRGRQLGFPTINIKLKTSDAIDSSHKLIPLDGVYIVRVEIDNQIVKGVMSIGRRPTFEASPSNGERWLEAHLLDFNKEIYGSDVKVSFLKRIRPIRRFKDPETLIKVIQEDIKKTRQYFGQKRISPAN